MKKLVSVALMLSCGLAFASEADADASKWYAMAAAISIAIAAFGGALGQGRAVTAALEGIARNPGASDKIFMPMIIGLALSESLVIYVLVISFILSGKF